MRALLSTIGSRGAPVDDEPDCLAITEANLRALFPHVAAVVHHGGAGTPTTTALAGVPQVVVPHHYDQNYFAQRVQDLGIGAAHKGAGSLTEALRPAFQPDVAARARSFAPEVRTGRRKGRVPLVRIIETNASSKRLGKLTRPHG
ncbi:MAG TPA: nucleotide disphospho-sugar-binding domain-containing protein [Amycolatopsis sp.]|uniref:glycosyltransferase n=1 Tax=Amycolatopsis sp. TaxID=37632 RepID=UPI002B493B79|nr:nucleotide disphospho-sugar-binding domain-containing protein [Amycolatopsis sp.]HKS49224.1 nucleotide disphospho-sugar-binding domain-containing protein [Amycolatopsis sp.]